MGIKFPFAVNRVTSEVRAAADAIEFAGFAHTFGDCGNIDLEGVLVLAGLTKISTSASGETLARHLLRGELHVVKLSPQEEWVTIRVLHRLWPLLHEVRNWALQKNDDELQKLCEINGERTLSQWQDICYTLDDMHAAGKMTCSTNFI